MTKLLLLPLVLLLINCIGSNKASTRKAQNGKEEQWPFVGGQEGVIKVRTECYTNGTPLTASSQAAQEQQATIQQGIAGRVLWVSGNQMPSPDVPRSSGKKGIQRQVFIYQLTKGAQATTTDGVFHTKIQTNLVTQVVTDANGYFAVSLEPGRYSIFTKEEQGLFANLFDGENNIYPVEVKQGEVTQVEFLINYNATY
ncbi:carboxypeptidase regulatory-like domain-containing protein [Pontibacter sp. 13R65]|uniref:carboxypeptidase regulatory-like domain-containing protein n=1 Tax=Pontibacter sp. 13R65 TaxID=3127458 RepID=UPI00301CF491